MGNDPNAWQRIENIKYDELPTQLGDAAIGWAGGHVAAGNMYVFNPQYTVRRAIFSHHVAYPAAGSTNPFTFFNVPNGKFICDFPGGGNGLPGGTLYMLDGISFHFTPSMQVDGTAIAIGYPGVLGAATPAAIAGEIAAALDDGLVKVNIGERVVVDGVHGLKFFPEGAGVTGSAAIAEPGSAAAFVVANNGDANILNRGFPIDPIVPIFPNKAIQATVEFSKARPISLGAACRFTMRLHGTYISRGTNF